MALKPNIKRKEKNMKAYVYNVETMEVVVVISGETNEQCEAKANDMGYMGVDEYGLTYSPAFGSVDGLVETEYTEEVEA
ncbi:hypothetical protein [Vibrio sp. YT-17]|uniref:hypothetical protein n=1 Tax=Vibrio sp. YT-17 TaxID=3074708 RepID=UPI0029651648|nr:hypothetical protein [Vibrio sp. YT-17]MDW1542448.1 hypothetical protein [Vibrio sp. YT-17]